MATIRAKFHCQDMTEHYWSAEAKTYRFRAVYDHGLVEEDRAFAKASPTGTLEIQVDNPHAQFEVGAFYYLDFIKVDQPAVT